MACKLFTSVISAHTEIIYAMQVILYGAQAHLKNNCLGIYIVHIEDELKCHSCQNHTRWPDNNTSYVLQTSFIVHRHNVKVWARKVPSSALCAKYDWFGICFGDFNTLME